MNRTKLVRLAREKALSNGHDFHVAAALIRRGKLVSLRTNGGFHKSSTRYLYSFELERIEHVCESHAETKVIQNAKPGDKLVVLRFLKDGSITMAKPCSSCQLKLNQVGLTNVVYTNWEGQFKRLQ